MMRIKIELKVDAVALDLVPGMLRELADMIDDPNSSDANMLMDGSVPVKDPAGNIVGYMEMDENDDDPMYIAINQNGVPLCDPMSKDAAQAEAESYMNATGNVAAIVEAE